MAESVGVGRPSGFVCIGTYVFESVAMYCSEVGSTVQVNGLDTPSHSIVVDNCVVNTKMFNNQK